jgi:outer membrane protein assembly factor BamB
MRLRVPLTLAVVNVIAHSVIWLVLDRLRQIQVMASIGVLGLSGVVLFLWFVFASGAPRRARTAVAAAVMATLVLSVALFRIRGVTGDLVPIIEYRFAAARILPEAQQPPMAAAPSPESVATATIAPNPEAPASVGAVPPKASPAAGSTGPAASSAAAAAPPTTTQNHLDWPQYLGPGRLGLVPDVALATDWTSTAPRLLWRQPVGAGWSGFAVSGDIAVTMEQRGRDEKVMAYDLKSGRPLWSHGDAAAHDSPLGGLGPRGVPAIDQGQVFSLGATGLLNALDLRTGRRLWSRNVLRDNQSSEPEWGLASSPLVHGDRVIVGAGGASGRALVAYDRATGEPLWAAGNGRLAYSSPALMTLAGREQVVMMNQASVAGHDPVTGAVLWESSVPGTEPRAAQPLPLSPDRVLFSIGYGIGSKVFEISAGGESAQSAKLVWATPRLKSKFANLIAHEGSVYGLDDGVFVCLDPLTGERRWKAGRYGHGQIILAGKHLLVQAESGEVILIEPNPERLIEIARFRALEGKTWNPPAFAAPILLVRNDLEAAAYEMPVLPR